MLHSGIGYSAAITKFRYRMVCANKGGFSEYISEWKQQNEEYIKYVCGLFSINFCVWCEVGSQGFVSILVHMDIQLIQHLLCKWPKLQPLSSGGCLCVDLPQDFILSHLSIYLSLCKHHNIFITITLRLEIWWRKFSNISSSSFYTAWFWLGSLHLHVKLWTIL